ncbi:MAG: tRNA (adenosine(37)-N6)-threonylcarbamoyltransferase complex transferase subunit TsaD [Pseudomonadota bacterium]
MQKTSNGNSKPLTVLGIESSCDDTAVGIIIRHPDGRCEIKANEIRMQFDRHAAYGGVVPEIAARSHVERIDLMIEGAVQRSGFSLSEIDLIAATGGPGLIGGVIVGLSAAKGLALSLGRPLVVVNHLEAHALSARMTEPVSFPFLLLLVSGGHSQLIEVERLGVYRRLGTTIDDAAGEAFDKTAKLLGLGQPGGPKIEALAQEGDPERFSFPMPLRLREGADFSFSGLKTAVRVEVEKLGSPSRTDIADIAAGFQKVVVAHLVAKTRAAMAMFEEGHQNRQLVVAGGVAANKSIGKGLKALAEEQCWSVFAPPLSLCTDNGAMVAWAGAEHAAAGQILALADALAFAPRARWPLAPPPEGKAQGGGKKGPKA